MYGKNEMNLSFGVFKIYFKMAQQNESQLDLGNGSDLG